MREFLLDFKFKGGRNYVHGTDLYTEVLRILKNEGFSVSNIDLSFHKIARNNLKAVLLPAQDRSLDASNPVSIFKFIDDSNDAYILRLFETESAVNGSYEYDEEQVVNDASLHISEKSISLTSAAPYNNIEKVVALNKALLNQLLSDPGKWYFARLTVDEDINQKNPNVVSLKLVKNIGSKITKTLILFNNKEQGYIYFSKV